MLDLMLFGTAEVRVAGRLVPTPPPKELALLAYLALKLAPVPRDTLHELLWPTGGRVGLRVALSRLRGVRGSEDWLVADHGVVGVRATSDVMRFQAALGEGATRAALEMWPAERGELLAGLTVRSAEPFHEWLESERDRLGALRSDARRGRLAELERGGQTTEALVLGKALIADDPLDEAAHRAVMRLEHVSGNTETALAQFERLRVLLRDDVGTEPAPETLAELARIEGNGGGPGERAVLLDRGDAVPDRSSWMVGRGEPLRRVEAAVQAAGRVLVHGAGGMGKTTLAAEIAAGRLESGGRVLWARSGDADPAAVFDSLAAALDARAEVARSRSQSAALRHVMVEEGVTVVVLDDAANAYAVARMVDALPKGCGLVVTSRQRYPGLERVKLDRLQRSEAIELLEFHAGRVIAQADAEALCVLLGDHPYAVRIAGVALSAMAHDVGDLITRVRAAPHALALPEDLAEPGRESVAALLEVSLGGLADDAYEALMALGALSGPSATPELVAELTQRDANSTENALEKLQVRALAERLTEPGSDVIRYRLHDLTHSLAHANTHVRRSSARRACLRYLQLHFREHDLLDADLGQVVTAVRDTVAVGEDSDAVVAMARLCGPAGYFNGRGHTAASMALLERVAMEAEAIDIPAAQMLHVKLGNAHKDLRGDMAAARDCYRRAAELAHELGDGRREAIASGAMGCAEVVMGASGGEDTVLAALALARRLGDDLALAHTLQNLSYVAGVKGRLDESAALSAEAVEAADRLGPDVDPQEADHKRFYARFNLGVARWQGGDSQGGREALEDALSVARQRGNPGWAAYALQELADLEDSAGNKGTALERAHGALELYERHRMRRDAQALRTWLAERETSR